jgi:pre-mRNA-splicing factor CWC26
MGKKMADGSKAGLRRGSEFQAEMDALNAKKKAAMAAIDPTELGKNAPTVYRDRRGKKLDMLSEMMHLEAVRQGREVKQKVNKIEWGTGKKQRDDAASAAEELAAAASRPFARYEDDAELENRRKAVTRDGDPMAGFMTKKYGASGKGGGGVAVADVSQWGLPKYKGPPAPGNRFGIPPGYRWDGVVRSNGFEDRMMRDEVAANVRKEESYKWSTSDM